MKQAGDAIEIGPRSTKSNHKFEITLDMIRAGVKLYQEFDPEENEPEALIGEILFTARDIYQEIG